MAREFLVYSNAEGCCTVKADDEEDTEHTFADILDALAFVRQRKGESTATLTVFRPDGTVAFSHLI